MQQSFTVLLREAVFLVSLYVKKKHASHVTQPSDHLNLRIVSSVMNCFPTLLLLGEAHSREKDLSSDKDFSLL